MMKLMTAALLLICSAQSSFAMSCVADQSYVAGVWRNMKGICEGGYTFSVKGLALGIKFQSQLIAIRCSSPVKEGVYWGSGLDAGVGPTFGGALFARASVTHPMMQDYCAMGELTDQNLQLAVSVLTRLKINAPTKESLERANQIHF